MKRLELLIWNGVNWKKKIWSFLVAKVTGKKYEGSF